MLRYHNNLNYEGIISHLIRRDFPDSPPESIPPAWLADTLEQHIITVFSDAQDPDPELTDMLLEGVKMEFLQNLILRNRVGKVVMINDIKVHCPILLVQSLF